MSSEVVSALDTASDVADTIAKAAPGPLGLISKVASVALKAASGIAAAGGDPVIEITRLLTSSDGGVGEVHDDWDDFIANNFPKSQPPSPDTDPVPDDPYEG